MISLAHKYLLVNTNIIVVHRLQKAIPRREFDAEKLEIQCRISAKEMHTVDI